MRAKEMNKREVTQLVEILKMVNDPDLLLLQELLDTICERFQDPVNDYFGMTVSCSRHPDHHNVDEGFQLLELAEGMMGTSQQQIMLTMASKKILMIRLSWLCLPGSLAKQSHCIVWD